MTDVITLLARDHVGLEEHMYRVKARQAAEFTSACMYKYVRLLAMENEKYNFSEQVVYSYVSTITNLLVHTRCGQKKSRSFKISPILFTRYFSQAYNNSWYNCDDRCVAQLFTMGDAAMR